MDLADYRSRIDEIDREILRLFEKRMVLAGEIGAWKQARSLPVCQPEREAQKLDALKNQASPELLPYDTELFNTLFSLSRSYQEKECRP